MLSPKGTSNGTRTREECTLLMLRLYFAKSDIARAKGAALYQLSYTGLWREVFTELSRTKLLVRGNHQNSDRLVLDQFGYSVEYPLDLVL